MEIGRPVFQRIEHHKGRLGLAVQKRLYRAVDEDGDTIDFLLAAKRDQKAALRFLKKAVRQHGVPVKINTDKSGANAAGLKAFNDGGWSGFVKKPTISLESPVPRAPERTPKN